MIPPRVTGAFVWGFCIGSAYATAVAWYLIWLARVI